MMTAWVLLPLLLAGPAEPLGPIGQKLVPADMQLNSEREIVEALAKVFADSLVGAKADLLAAMGTDPFTFDGRVVSGRQAILQTWKDVFAKHGRRLERAGSPGLEAIDYPEAIQRFGPPPKKFSHLPLSKCWFAVLRFPKRAGLVLILSRGKDADEGWLVTGVTD
jgi:hypothetical protein